MNDASAPPTHCTNCGAPLADRYCGRCGQDSHASLSFGHFTHELVEGLFHVDSKFWRTLRTLLIRPGLLTQQYLDGKRSSYSPPFRSYLVISIAYFIIASVFGASGARVLASSGQQLTAADCAQMAAHPGWFLKLVPDLQASCERALSNNGRALTAAMENLLPKVMFVVLPLVALVQFCIYRRQRPLYLENLVFVLHFQSFYYLASAAALLLAAGIGVFTSIQDAIGQAFGFAVFAWSIVYLLLAERRVYRASMLKIVFGLLALAASYAIFYSLGIAVAGIYAFIQA